MGDLEFAFSNSKALCDLFKLYGVVANLSAETERVGVLDLLVSFRFFLGEVGTDDFLLVSFIFLGSMNLTPFCYGAIFETLRQSVLTGVTLVFFFFPFFFFLAGGAAIF